MSVFGCEGRYATWLHIYDSMCELKKKEKTTAITDNFCFNSKMKVSFLS